jgi:hypothetical protein
MKDKTLFKGNCRLCGEYGHKAIFCKKREDKSKTVCNHCKKAGHMEKECFRKARHNKKKGENTDNERNLEVLMATESKDDNSLTWIGDTGATSHMTNDDEGMFDIEPNNQQIVIGSGETMKAVKKGKLKLKTKGKNGEETIFILSNVLFVPWLWKKLFSISKVIKEGGKINSLERHMIIEKGKIKLKFTEERGLFKIPLEVQVEKGLITGEPEKKVNINTFHKRLGHPCLEMTKITAKNMNIELNVKWEECKECLMGKAKQKGCKKVSKNKSTITGKQLSIDISYLKNSSFGGSKYWLLIVDEATNMMWSHFFRRKPEASRKIIEFVTELKLKNANMVKFIRCNNLGENQALKQEMKKKGFNLQFEFTAPGTPQENGKVERAFATLWGRTRAMLNQAQ